MDELNKNLMNSADLDIAADEDEPQPALQRTLAVRVMGRDCADLEGKALEEARRYFGEGFELFVIPNFQATLNAGWNAVENERYCGTLTVEGVPEALAKQGEVVLVQTVDGRSQQEIESKAIEIGREFFGPDAEVAFCTAYQVEQNYDLTTGQKIYYATMTLVATKK